MENLIAKAQALEIQISVLSMHTCIPVDSGTTNLMGEVKAMLEEA